MKNSLLFTGKQAKTLTGMLFLLVILAFGSLEKTTAQVCVINQTAQCPTGPIIACAEVNNGGVLGANITWTPPQFALDCGAGSGETGTQMSFELPESQNGCWIYNKVQRTGNNGGRLQLNQSTGTGLPYFITPEFFIPSTGITGTVEIFADEAMTMRIYYAKNGLKVSAAVATISISASTAVQPVNFVLAPPSTPGFYQLMYEFTGLTNNKSYVDNLDIDALIASNGCAADIDFYTTVTAAPPIALIDPTGTFFPAGTTTVTYTATYNSSAGSQTLECSFAVIVHSVSASAVTTPSDCGTNNGTITISASSNPALSAFEYNIDNGTIWIPFTTPVTITGLAANTYSINVRASFPANGVCDLVSPVIAVIGNNIDAIAPVVTCPVALNLTGCDVSAITIANSGLVYSSSPTSITLNQYTAAGATATDNCSIASYSYQDAQSGTCPVVVTRTFTATDNSGNSSSCNQLITIGHTAAPLQIGGPVPIASTVSCINLAVAPVLPVVQDFCGNVLTPGTPIIGGTYTNCEGTRTYSYIWTDCAGLTYNWTYTYTIEREPFPAIAPTNATVGCYNNISLPVPPIVYDNCGSLITNVSGPIESTIPTCEGDVTYTWTYTDCEGNSQLYVHTVTIERADFTVPTNTTATVACVANIVVPTPPVVNDACGNPITPEAGTAPIAPLCEGTMVYSWTYTDCEGNSHVWSHTVTIERLPFAPIAPTSATVACAANIVMPTLPLVTDNCGATLNPTGPVVSTIPTCEGDVTYTWTYTDCEGNTQNYVHTVTIERADFTLPANTSATVACVANIVVPTPPVVNDACGNPITPLAGTAPIAPSCEGTMVYSWTYTDCEGNSHVWSHTITIERLPFAPIAPTSATVACAANIVMPTLPIVTDNCGTTLNPTGPVVSTIPTCEGDVTYTWIYTDCEGNTQNYVHTVTIERADFTLTANTSATVACIADIVVPTPPVVNDACGNPITPVAGTAPIAPSCEGTMVYSWTYTDCEGNNHVWSHTVTIERLPFAPIAPTSATVACAANIVMPTLPIVTDNCGTTLNPTGPVVSTIPTCEGDVTYTWTYTDCEGNTQNYVHTVTIERADFTLPANTTATVACVANIVVPTPPAVNDACGNPITPLAGTAPIAPSCEGTMVYSWTYTDCEGNSHVWSHTVTIERLPFAPIAPTSATVACAANIVMPTLPIVTDNCGTTLNPTGPVVSTIPTCEGDVTYTWTYTDCEGNSQLYVHTVTIDRADFIMPLNGSETVQCATAVYQPIPPVVTDACGVTITPTGPVIGGTYVSCEGTRTYTWTYSDCAGNSHAWTYTFNIDDNTPPTFTRPANITIYADANCNYNASITVTGDVTNENDNCSTGLQATYVDQIVDGTCEGSHIISRTWRLTDNCGNAAANQIQTITVTDNTIPTWVTEAGSLNASIDCGNESELAAAMAAQPIASDNCSTVTVNEVETDDCFGNDQSGNINAGSGNYFYFNVDGYDNLTANEIATLSLQFQTNQGKGRAEFTLVSPSGQGIILVGPYCTTGYCSDPDPSTQEIYAPTFYADASGYPQWNNNDLIPQGAGNFTPYGGLTSVNAGTITGMTQGYVSSFEEFTGPMNGTWFVFARKQQSVNGSIDFNSICLVPGSCDNNDLIVRSWVATDDCGNTSTPFTQVITVSDDSAPVITLPSANLTMDCYDASEVAAWIATASATDACQGVVNVTSNFTAPADNCDESVTVTFTAVDNCGNIATETKAFIVDDNTAPILSTLAGSLDVTVECSDPSALAAALALVPTATDNCSLVVTRNLVSDNTTPSPNCINGYVRVRTWNFTDDCGNVSSIFVQTITVDDNTAPVITAPAPINIICDINNDPTTQINAWLATAYATDNCDELVTVSNDFESFTQACNEIINVTFNATDACGNQATPATSTFTFVDEISPVITTEAGSLNASVECSDATAISAALALVPSANDNCTSAPYIHLLSDVTTPDATCENGYVRVRTWNFTDDCGNVSANFIQTITVIDNTAPVINTLAGSLDVTLQCSDATGITAALAMAPTATDNCSEVVTLNVVSDVTTPDATCENGYIRVRTWNFTDDCGNVSANFVQTITVIDNTAPVINTLVGSLDVALQCSDAAGMTAALLLAPTATDNCSEVVTMNVVSDVTTPDATCENGYVRVRAWNFTDDCGNVSANFVQTITVIDNTAPVINTLAGSLDMTLQCSDAAGMTAALLLAPTATDNCSEVVTMNVVSDVTTPDATCENGYVRIRTWNFTDDCGNTSVNFVQTITVIDNTAPVINTLAGSLDVALQCSDAAGITAALLMAPTATDNCSEVVTMNVVSDITTPDATCENGYVRVRTWNFTDDCGNTSANFVQTITVIDNTAPVINTLAGSLDVALQCSDATGITATLLLAPTATDNCSEVVTMNVVSDVTTPDATCENGYVRVRTWNFTDDCGNVSANFVQTITVIDNTSPVINTLAGSLDMTLQCSDAAGITAALLMAPTATDNCSELVTMNVVSDLTTPDATCENGYVRIRTWNFTDDCGNTSANFVQTITVIDNTAPVINTLAGSLDVTLQCSDAAGISAALLLAPTATDNCSEVVTMNVVSDVTTPDETCANGYVRVRTWNFTDDCGNVSANFVQTITVDDNTAPLITAPAPINIVCDLTSDPTTQINAWLATAEATDNCDDLVTVTNNFEGFTQSCNEIITVTFYATDACGNLAAPVTSTFTFIDEIDPIVTTLAGSLDATVECSDPTGLAVALALAPTATDNCTLAPYINLVSDITTADETCENGYVRVRTWNFTDDCGNESVDFVQTITVIDNTVPVINTLAGSLDVTLECSDETGLTTALSMTPTATDNCSEVITMNVVSDVTTPDATCENGYVRVRTWNFTDDCGNVSANFVQTITVIDNTAPVINTLAGSLDATLECSDATGLATALALSPTASDNCSEVLTMNVVSDVTTPDPTCANGYVRVRTWNFTDDCGNVSEDFVQTITVDDNTIPVITAPAPLNIVCDITTDPTTQINEWLASAYATDNCDDMVTVTNSYEGYSQSCNETVTITFYATDACGKQADPVTSTFTFIDEIAPVITTVAGSIDATVECSDELGLVAALAMVPTATDNCTQVPTIHLISDITTNNTECDNEYTRVRTWNFTDDCGNTSESFTQTISIIDNTPPVWTITPTDLTVECDGEGNTAALNAWLTGYEGIDNCGIVSITNNYTGLSDLCGATGSATVTFSISDECGNTTNTVATFTIADTQGPIFTYVPENITVECGGTFEVGTPIASDDCSSAVIAYLGEVRTDGNCANNYTLLRTWSATDDCGNVSTATQLITVQDNTAPEFTFIPANVTVECDEIPEVGTPIATDLCDPEVTIAYIGEVRTDGNCPNNYTLTRTWTATDNCENVATGTQVITVNDVTAPVFTVIPENITVECDGTGNAAELQNWLNSAIATDNCGVATITNNYTGLTNDCGATGTATVTFTANDGCNNISTISATFTIVDTQAPEINAPANIFADNDPGLCGAQVNVPVPAASDDCGTFTITNNITGTGNASGFYEVGSTTIIWTAIDECGNTSTDQTVVTVEDTEAPHIICPQHITVVADAGVCEAFIEVPQPIVSDNCEIREVTNTFNHTDDATGIYPVGTTVVWWTVVDMSGNTDNCFMNVTVIDEQDPTITCPEDITVNTDPGVCEAQVNVPLPEAADNCTINSLVNDFNGTGDASGIYPVGTTIVTWTVTDMSGNSATCSMTVTVNDNELPTIICPESISVNTDPGVCGADVTVPQPELHDNCDINTLVNNFNNTSNASGFYPTGTTEVIWTVTDIHGNSATCTMTVTVTDNEAPSIICPTDIAQNTDAGICGANVTVPSPEAIDNCGIHSVINDFNGTNDASGLYPTGVTVITWTVTDIHGLTATCQTTVTVTDNELPVIICPTDIEIAADQTCQVTLEIPVPEVTDNCGVENFINDYTSTANASGIYPVGSTVVTWTVTDINGNITTCAITVHVTAPPFAVDDYASTEVGTPVTIPVLVNDTDCNSDIVPSTVINITNPANGSVMVDPATGEFIYTPNAGFTGTDFFEYRVCDAEGLCDEATVTITIEDTGVDKLIAVDDAYSMEENTVLEITNLENDIYTPYTPVITVLVPPTHGNLVINSDMTATYTPDTDYDGTDEYTYILSDLNNGATADTAITTITIVPAPARDTLIIYNVITPDNDGRNDKWVIDGIEEYGDNEVLIFNRWGDQVRQFDRYDNNTVVWDGTNASGDMLPAATYYYIIRLRSIEKVYTGWVIIHSKK